jgi:hypothetical protein
MNYKYLFFAVITFGCNVMMKSCINLVTSMLCSEHEPAMDVR